ncbi:MAG: GNAT family N-acetyltransferase [Brevundimonas sp.]|uniref:GNAT family N-acetyltransferase n=1 Tax=Brevundimonas sp. TaxID=1871086 RepID=UPI002734CBDF|nr:GNAT family N-acetyltransferase [Brevundimonas sp.]MDP3403241.1 GNAT family N-acetyltransferase [Brevundimonas sp.]
MTELHDRTADQRWEQTFEGPDGQSGRVWADYAIEGDRRAILHVEADDALRGTGAAGRFMQALADHARAANIRLTPRCGYAVAWFKRHPDHADLLG